MPRQMRRIRQSLSHDETVDILIRGTSGVLALYGDDGYPYAVPLSYVYDDGHIYFHCARSGHKLDAIRRDDHASFCVVDQDMVVPEEYTTYFRSAIAFGRIRIVDDPDEFWDAARKLGMRFAPNDSPENLRHIIENSLTRMLMLDMEIEHITGKAARELIQDRPRATE